MHEFKSAEMVFYGVAFAAGFLGCFFRQLRDTAAISWRVLLINCAASGGLGFVVVALVVNWFSSSFATGGPWALVALAWLIGFAAKEQDKYGYAILRFVAAKIGIQLPTNADDIAKLQATPKRRRKTDSDEAE